MADQYPDNASAHFAGIVTGKKTFPQVYFLRAFASLMVCVFHLVCGNGNLFQDKNLLKTSSSYGYLGVDVFFIISGFIICYALPQGYSLQRFKTFMGKRLIRIEPPYVISILLVILLNALASRFNHSPVQFSWLNFFYHFAYLNNFGLGEYYSVVYWTLGIEFQFYLLIGLLYPLINKSKLSIIVTIMLTAAASFTRVKNIELVFFYLPLFGLGILSYFFIVQKKVSGPVFICMGILLFLALFFKHGVPVFFAAVFGITGLLFFRYNHPLVRFFSDISFSLYLTHTIIGGKIINLGLRFADRSYERYLLVLLAFTGSVFAAWAFYRIIEKPALLASKKVIYKSA